MRWHLREYGWRLLPGGITALTIALLLKLGAFQSLEQIAYRWLFQNRGAIGWDKQVVVVAIDDASIKQLGRFPWSRQQYVGFFKRLAAAQSNIVVVDLLWTESSPEDRQLAQAMNQHGQVVLAQAWDETGVPLLPVPMLEESAITTGHVLKREDTDGLVRHIDLQIQSQPALGIAAIQAANFVQTPIPLPPLDQTMWVNWVGAVRQLQQYSFVDVVQGKIPVQAFDHKIVLLGVTATGLDPLVTPYDRNPPASSVHLHATVIQNLLQHNALHPIQVNWALVLLLGGPVLSWLMASWGTRQQLIVITGLFSGWALVSLLLFQTNQLLPVAPPVTLFAMTATAVALSERLRENYLLRRQIAQIWDYYRQDLVISTSDTFHPLVPVQTQQLPQPEDTLLRVTQLAALAEQLGRSQSTQAAIARTLCVGLLASDLDGTVWFCNPLAAEWLQINVGSHLNGQLTTWLTAEQWQFSLEHLKAGVALKHTNLQQGDKWFEMSLNPLSYRQSHHHATNQSTSAPPPVDGFLLVLEEVTEYKRVEAELQQAKEIAVREAARSKAASQAKSEFLANISHELRTPLNIILGFTQVMSHDEALNSEHRKHLEIINRSGQHLLTLINDVLEMSKIEAGRARLNKTSFDLHYLLSDLEDMLRIKAASKNLKLIFDQSPNLPRYISTDEGKLRQILLNLLGNAIKFTEQGSVILRVSRVTSIQLPVQEDQAADWSPTADTCSLHFAVEDTGPGIAPSEIENLFRPFVQTKTGQQAQEGTGLGLAISQKFIHLMGGEITIDSVVGQGCTFRFHIQAECASEQDVSITLSVGRVVALVPGQPTYRILIMEDRHENSQFLLKLLMPLGFAVREAKNGQDGLAIWKEWHPHLVLMDLHMPVMDGYTATRQLRSLERLARTPHSRTIIIALTANVFEETKASVTAIGCDDFLSKPVQVSLLLAKFSEYLGVRYVYEHSQSQPEPDHLLPSAKLAPASTHYHLSQMPTTWITRLHWAAVKGRDRQILQLIQQIPLAQAELARQLNDWTYSFQFDEIINLTQRFIE